MSPPFTASESHFTRFDLDADYSDDELLPVTPTIAPSATTATPTAKVTTTATTNLESIVSQSKQRIGRYECRVKAFEFDEFERLLSTVLIITACWLRTTRRSNQHCRRSLSNSIVLKDVDRLLEEAAKLGFDSIPIRNRREPVYADADNIVREYAADLGVPYDGVKTTTIEGIAMHLRDVGIIPRSPFGPRPIHQRQGQAESGI